MNAHICTHFALISCCKSHVMAHTRLGTHSSIILKAMSGSSLFNNAELDAGTLRAGSPVHPTLHVPPFFLSHKDSLVSGLTQDIVAAAGNTTAFHL